MSPLSNYKRHELLTSWLTCTLLPLPALVIWHSTSNSGGALGLFFVGCVTFTAIASRDVVNDPSFKQTWRNRSFLILAGLLTACAVFCAVAFAVHGTHDLALPFVAFQILIPSFCVTPYLLLVTRKQFATVVFTLFLVGSMKMLAGIVTNLVYGWENGHHELPWFAPNLMLSAFWVHTLILCTVCYLLGAKALHRNITVK